MDGPRNNLDEIKRRNYLRENAALRSESKKTKTEGFKFKLGTAETSESIYPSINKKEPRKFQSYIPTVASLHTQHMKPDSTPGHPTPTRKVTPSSIPLKRPSPDASTSSSKRPRKDIPLVDSTRSNLPVQQRQGATAQPATRHPALSKPPRDITASPQRLPEMPTNTSLKTNKSSRLDAMSMDRLVKLKLSRQQKTIDHAELIMGRLKAKDEDDMEDIELIEAQYSLLKNSIKEVESAIARRRALEGSSSSPSFSPSTTITPITFPAPPSLHSEHIPNVESPLRNTRVTVQTVERRTEAISTDITSSEPTSSLGTSTTLCSTNTRGREESDEADNDDKLWDEIGELDDIPLPKEAHSPQAGRQLISSTVVEIKTVHQTIVSPTKGFPRASQVPTKDYSGDSRYNEAVRVLRNVFKKENFRHNQAEAIMGTLKGRDVFVLMPTGGGKSMCYQVPAVCTSGKTRGISIVISPLLSLMKDQVDELNRLGVDVAVLNSEQTAENRKETFARLRKHGSKPALLYLSPEMLDSSDVVKGILKTLHERNEIARFVVDESHLLSQWGRNFRAAYLTLKNIRIDYPNVPIMALTATATDQVAQDVIDILRMKDCIRLQQSFNRPNLTYSVVHKGKDIIKDVAEWIKENHPRETGVIYCLSQLDCETVAQALSTKHGIKASFYHGSMDGDTKRQTQSDWQKGKIQVIVATIAFGMGIDKADVRFVVHHSIPKSLEGYYQETGRAGRDGQPADCVLYYSWRDVSRLHRMFDRSLQEGQITPEECARQQEDVRTVAKYCELDIDCRRVQVLRYFGQSFDRAECNEGCDNCASGRTGTGTLQDLTNEAIQIVRLVDESSDRLTQTHVVSIYMGKNTKEARERDWSRSSFYGKGAHLPPKTIERVLPMLLIKGYLKESIVKNGSFHSTYVQLGDTSYKLLDGTENFTMMISDSQKSNKKGKKNDKGKQRAITTVQSVNRTKSTEISYFEDDDDDLGRPIEEYSRAQVEDSDEECAPPPPKPTRRPAAAAQDEVINIDDDDDNSNSALSRAAYNPFHGKLQKLRRQIAKEKKKVEAVILSDECLETLALLKPSDISQFKQVLSDVYGDTSQVNDIMKRYGMRFLDLCVVEATARANSSKPKSTTSNSIQRNPPPSDTLPKDPNARKGNLRSKYTFAPANHRPGKVALIENTLAGSSRKGGIRGMEI